MGGSASRTRQRRAPAGAGHSEVAFTTTSSYNHQVLHSPPGTIGSADGNTSHIGGAIVPGQRFKVINQAKQQKPPVSKDPVVQGSRYYTGRGATQNYHKAFELFKKSNTADGKYWLASM